MITKVTPRLSGRALAAATTVLLVAAALPAAAGTAPADSAAPPLIEPRPVPAVLETPPLFDDEAGGDADGDDPAIWVNERHRAASRVITAVKDGGLRVYDLHGRELQAIPTVGAPAPGATDGRINNVDILSGVRLGRTVADLAVASDRGRDQLRFYRIDPVTGLLSDVTAAGVPLAFNTTQAEVEEQATVYGLDAFTDHGKPYVLATRRHSTEIGLFEVLPGRTGVTYRRVDRLDLPKTFTLPDGSTWSPCEEPGEDPQAEGTVVDPENGVAYLAQEDVGVWRVRLSGGRFRGELRPLERTREFGAPATYDADTEECIADPAPDPGVGGRLAADAEGLTILRTGHRTGTLVVSSQGDDTFYTYDRRTNRPLSRFAVVDSADGTVDGAQSSDGADVTGVPLPGFPRGLLVVHDGENTPDVLDDEGEARSNTNFVFVDAGFLR